MEAISLPEQSAEAISINLKLVGALEACTPDHRNILPTLRKANALFVALALAEGQSLPRKTLAGMLWSRNEPAQALARLRDTLHSLRQSIREVLGDNDLVRLVGDRVSLQPGAVRISLAMNAGEFSASDVASDLDGLDPALDTWLAGVRARLRGSLCDKSMSPPRPVSAERPPAPKRGSVIGVCLLNALHMQGDEYLSFALAEEIATALARIRGLIVISSGSVTAALAAKQDLRGELGLDFLLDGSLQRMGDRLRVTVKLVDASSGVVCWTSHFDYDANDLFAVQQDVAGLVAAGLEPEIPVIAVERMKRGGERGDGAYGLILRAISSIHLLERRSFLEAGELLARAIDLEPEYSPAYSWLALWNVFLVGQGWARDPQASIGRAGEAAEHAVMLDPNDARGLAIAGHVRAFLYRRLDEALPLHERALSINPSLPLAWHLSGVAQAYQGNLDAARHRLDQCQRLAPRDPHSFYAEGARIILELLSRNHESAAVIGRRVTQLHPRFSAAYKPYLSALGHLGEKREAVLVHRRLAQLEPEFSVRGFRATSPFALREHTDHYAAGLVFAGVT